MKKFLLFYIVFLFFFQACNENEKNYINPGQGQIILKLVSPKNPANISSIVAYLSNYDKQENILTLSDKAFADTLNNIFEDDWNLSIRVFDNKKNNFISRQFKFSLSYDQIINKNLTLISGNDTVIVNFYWEESKKWKDFSANPVLKPLNNNFDYGGIAQPFILNNDDLLNLLYIGVINNGVKYILSAQSQDGINWKRNYDLPLLSPGKEGEWDSWAVHPGPIIIINGVYYMYYTGFASIWGKWEVGLATSIDGIAWEKKSGPVIQAGNGWDSKIIPWSIVKKDDLYYMYYTARGDYDHPVIGLATSFDGIAWKNYENNPVLKFDFNWEEEGIHYPSVIIENGIFKMAYATVYSSAFGWATSTDGINWNKSSKPFFTKENDINNWADEIAYPFLIRIEGKLKCYYTGYKYKEDQTYTSSIGFIFRE